jgi:hypothetical protein
MTNFPQSASRKINLSFHGDPISLFGWGLWAGIAALLIIPGGWAAASLNKYVVNNTRTSDNTSISFEGKGEEIWGTYAGYTLCQYATYIPFIGLIFAFLIYLCELYIMKWFYSRVKIGNDMDMDFKGGYWGLVGYSILIGLSFITIIGWAWVAIEYINWIFRNVESRNYVLRFTGTGGEYLWRSIVYLLASILIIPIPWMQAWFIGWFISKIEIHVKSQPAIAQTDQMGFSYIQQ